MRVCEEKLKTWEKLLEFFLFRVSAENPEKGSTLKTSRGNMSDFSAVIWLMHYSISLRLSLSAVLKRRLNSMTKVFNQFWIHKKKSWVDGETLHKVDRELRAENVLKQLKSLLLFRGFLFCFPVSTWVCVYRWRFDLGMKSLVSVSGMGKVSSPERKSCWWR